MDDEKDYEARLHDLAGRIHALTAFGFAVIDAHPAPDELARQIDKAEQIALARVESSLVAENYLHGLRDVFDRLKIAAAKAQERRSDRS